MLYKHGFWVASEAKETICDFAKMLRNDPLCPIKDFTFLVGKVMNDIAEAMLHADSESLGWSYYAQVLEDEHCYDAQYAQQVIDTIKFWIENSSAEEKTKVATRFVIDFALYDRYFKMLSHAGRTGSSLIAQTPEIRFLESFADAYVEHKVVTNLGDVGLHGMEDVGTSLMQGEFEAVRYGNVIKVRSFDTALQELQTYGARCKLFQRELNTWFDNIFYKNELLNFYKDFKCPLCIEVMNRGQKAKLFCDLEHLMTYNLKFKLNKNTGLIEGFISGGHVGTYTKALEKAGEIVILSEQILPGGARALEYKHKFGSFIAQKTEFPLRWTAQDIIDCIKEAFSQKKYYNFENLSGHFIGEGKDGLLIEGFFKKLPDGKLKLKTAYPYCEQFSWIKL